MAGRRMKLGTMPSLQDISLKGETPRWNDIKEMAQTAEAVGLDSFWLADHVFFRKEGAAVGTWEGFTFLSALAAVTERLMLGPLVACTSFRNPALLAKMADALDEISGGRFILGLGAGWNEPEYTMFGWPFDHRVSRFAEAMQIVAPLLRAGQVDFHGQYYAARECVLRPRGPSAAGPPLLIGATRPRMLRLAARYADLYNTDTVFSVERVKELWDDVQRACEAVGRDPATLALTSFTNVAVLAPGESPNPAMAGKEIAGEPARVAEALRAFADAGVTHLIIRFEGERAPMIERFGRVIELLDAG